MNSPNKPTTEDIARVCHEANRAYCLSHGDVSHLPWDVAPEWQKESARQGVAAIIEDGGTSEPQISHKRWYEHKEREGWVYGSVKDSEKKTHPCMVSWSELPIYQKRKDRLFHAVVNGLLGE